MCSVNAGCLFRNDTLLHGSFQYTPSAMGNSFCKSAQLWLDPEIHFHHTSEPQSTIHLTLDISQARHKPPLIPLVPLASRKKDAGKLGEERNPVRQTAHGKKAFGEDLFFSRRISSGMEDWGS